MQRDEAGLSGLEMKKPRHAGQGFGVNHLEAIHMADSKAIHGGAQQLVRVFDGVIGGLPAQVCDGRELHTFLKNGKRFSDWIKQRINQYGFEENRDFVSFSPKSEKPQGGRPSTDYQLTLDMAKELSMVENNEQGRMARRYFIEMERKVLDSIGTQVPQAHENVASLPDIEHRAFGGRNVLIARFDGQPWFSAGNLCTALNLGSSDRIVRSLPARHKRKLERGSRRLWMVDAEGAFRAADYCKPGTGADYREWLSGIVKGRDVGIDCARTPEPTAPARTAPVAALPDTPEAFFSQPPNLEPGLPIDAINCQIRRTDATVALLISQFDGTCEGRLSDTHIANALWAVQGDLERLHALFAFGWRTSRITA